MSRNDLHLKSCTSTAHFLNDETTQMSCNLPLFSCKAQCLTSAVLSLPLVAEYCMTSRIPQLLSSLVFVILQLQLPVFVVFASLPPMTLILLACSLCPIIPSFLSSCMHLLHFLSVCFSHPHLPSSARLYQGLGKLCVHWVPLSFRYA